MQDLNNIPGEKPGKIIKTAGQGSMTRDVEAGKEQKNPTGTFSTDKKQKARPSLQMNPQGANATEASKLNKRRPSLYMITQHLYLFAIGIYKLDSGSKSLEQKLQLLMSIEKYNHAQHGDPCLTIMQGRNVLEKHAGGGAPLFHRAHSAIPARELRTKIKSCLINSISKIDTKDDIQKFINVIQNISALAYEAHEDKLAQFITQADKLKTDGIIELFSVTPLSIRLVSVELLPADIAKFKSHMTECFDELAKNLSNLYSVITPQVPDAWSAFAIPGYLCLSGGEHKHVMNGSEPNRAGRDTPRARTVKNHFMLASVTGIDQFAEIAHDYHLALQLLSPKQRHIHFKHSAMYLSAEVRQLEHHCLRSKVSRKSMQDNSSSAFGPKATRTRTTPLTCTAFANKEYSKQFVPGAVNLRGVRDKQKVVDLIRVYNGLPVIPRELQQNTTSGIT